MKNKFLLFLLIAIPMVSFANTGHSSSVDKTTPKITKDSPKADEDLMGYMMMYQKMISKSLGDMSLYKGEECQLSVHLKPDGIVKHVRISLQNKLCSAALNAVWDIELFPLPIDKDLSAKLIHFTIFISPQ